VNQFWNDFAKLYPIPPIPPPAMRPAYTGGNDLAVVLALAQKRRPEKVLEMYTALGHTAAALAWTLPEATVYAYDTTQELGVWPYPGNGGKPTGAEVPTADEVGRAIKALPPEVRERVHLGVHGPDDLHREIRAQGPYDFVFIDGNHSWRGVAEDTRVALDVVDEQAVLVWDDYWTPCYEVMRFIDVLNWRTADSIILVENTRVCYCWLTKAKYRMLKRAIADL
jgi:hypothetical protein